MKFSSIIISLVALSSFASAQYVQVQVPRVVVSYNKTFDYPKTSTTTLACSDYMYKKKYNTFGDLPNYPNVGASNVIEGPGSSMCGSCWHLTSEFLSETATRDDIFVIVIDKIYFNNDMQLSLATMNDLTNGNGTVNATFNALATQVDEVYCTNGILSSHVRD